VFGDDSDETIHHRTYTYRADGNLIGIGDLATGYRRFDLDAAGRVTAVHAANWSEVYVYDAAGNQTSASWPTTHPGGEATGDREYVGSRITRAGRVRYEHDELGRVVLRQKVRLSRRPDTWRYEWDAEDHLVSVITPDGTRWRYTYDPLGRRTAKLRLAADGAVVERVDFTWDGTTLCEQTNTSPDLPNPVILTWDHQGLRPIAQTERISAAVAPQENIDSRFFAIVTDLVGTPTELIDEQGGTAWRTRSTLWGTTAWAAGSATYTPLRFPGQYYDHETGLHYNYFRHYDAEAGRYLTPDPLGLAPAPNAFQYVTNPQTGTDALGLAPDSCPGTESRRGIYDFRDPNPDHPPSEAAVAAMRSTPFGGNIDCSEVAERILRETGNGRIINFTLRGDPEIVIPEEGGIRQVDYRYHDVYTDGRYVYDPAMRSDPIPYGDYERAIRLLNPGRKLLVGNGGYSGPLW